jgi:hypothetical protein
MPFCSVTLLAWISSRGGSDVSGDDSSERAEIEGSDDCDTDIMTYHYKTGRRKKRYIE